MANIIQWSHSSLDLFETCPKKYYHLKIAKDFKEEFSGPAAEEGIRVHKAFEDRLLKGKPLPADLQRHEEVLAKIESRTGVGYPEQQLAVTRDFELTDWFNKKVFGRAVIDYIKIFGETALILDWKTGKQHDDFRQLQLFAAFASIKFPEVKHFTTGYYWTQSKKITKLEVSKSELIPIWREQLVRVNNCQKATNTLDFPAKTSGLCKKHCIVTSCIYNGNYTGA